MQRNNEAKQNRGLSQTNDDGCHVLQNTMNSVPCVSDPVNGRKEKAATRNYRAGRQCCFHSYSRGLEWLLMPSPADPWAWLPGLMWGLRVCVPCQLPGDTGAAVQGTIC